VSKDFKEKFEEALRKWNALEPKIQLISIITVFLWLWYLFMGRRNIEAWKVLLVNTLLVWGIATAKSKKRRDIVKTKNGYKLKSAGKSYICKTEDDAKELKKKINR
jgi:hypothetical protein